MRFQNTAITIALGTTLFSAPAVMSPSAAQEISAGDIVRQVRSAAQGPKPKRWREVVFANAVNAEREPFDPVPATTPPLPTTKTTPIQATASMECQHAAIFRSILFRRGSAALEPDIESRRTIRELAKALTHLDLAQLSFQLSGHSDRTGNDRINIPLSQARAESVLSQLVSLGVSPKRLSAKGYGSTLPADERHPAGPINRRVELCVFSRA